MNSYFFKLLRLKNGYSQEEFARLLGVSQALVAGIESGRQSISDYVRARLVVNDLKLDEDFFLFLNDYEKMNIISQ